MFATLHQSWIIYWFSMRPRSIHLHAFNHALFPFRLKVLPTLHYSLVVPPAPPDHLHKKELFLNAHLESHAYHEISRDCTTAGIINLQFPNVFHFASLLTLETVCLKTWWFAGNYLPSMQVLSHQNWFLVNSLVGTYHCALVCHCVNNLLIHLLI